MDNAPKLFISYSWSNPEHEQWVLDLATQLRESGVDVILDKWDLKEGHDSVSFMEMMVTDPQVTKVAVISDQTYADKADGRSGGVGTETQIISRQVYEKQDQQKFVAVLPAKDSKGKPFLPTYYKGRIYIDLSESDRYAENFEKLLRWIFDKPLHVKPELGKAPAFLNEETAISLGTITAQRRLLDALRAAKPYVLGALDEYLLAFSSNLEKFRINLTGPSEKYDETVAASIEQFTPHRNEFVQVVMAISQYLPTQEVALRLHRFFERLYPYMHRPEGQTQWTVASSDNYRFVVHELYLYTMGILIKDEHFNLAAFLISTPYYIAWHPNRGEAKTVSFADFREYMETFKVRSKRLRRLSSRADLLKERSQGSGVDFRIIMQADFVLYLRAEIENAEYGGWWPETLLFATHSYGAFELFARSRSLAYFQRVKILLGISVKEDLVALMEGYKTGGTRIPSWDFERFDPAVLMGLDELAIKQ
jgi:hypothetical protein